MQKITAVVVDDERPARERLLALLQNQPDIDLLTACRNGAEAIEVIREQRPDLVFLDIQMPELDGFAVVRALRTQHLPVIIFVTAYDSYAIQAFEVNALDYLLKPFSDERFETTLARARRQIGNRQSSDFRQALEALLTEQAENNRSPTKLDRLAIKSPGRIFFLETDDIDWIEAAGVYVNLHVGRDSHLYRETIRGLDAQLDDRQFVRIHRSTIVNVDRIKELQPYSHGEFLVILKDGTKLKLSRTYRARLQERIGRAF